MIPKIQDNNSQIKNQYNRYLPNLKQFNKESSDKRTTYQWRISQPLNFNKQTQKLNFQQLKHNQNFLFNTEEQQLFSKTNYLKIINQRYYYQDYELSQMEYELLQIIEEKYSQFDNDEKYLDIIKTIINQQHQHQQDYLNDMQIICQLQQELQQ